MTSAWKLFWKSHTSRGADEQQPPPDPPDSGLRHPHPRPRPRHAHASRLRHRDESHHLHRPHSFHRSFCHRGSEPEQESFRLDHRGSSDLETGNRINSEVALRLTSRLSLITNTQLPESVLQARERLVERLRGVSGTRESTIDDFIDRGDETRRDWIGSSLDYLDSADDQRKKNPSVGVNWDTLCSLHLEVFEKSEETVDCCICLESFGDGDGLIRLNCGHRFHPLCLEPWVKNCTDCPYCRANVTC